MPSLGGAIEWLWLVPVLLVLAYMFATRGRFGGVEWTLGLENFERALDPLYLNVLLDSLVIASASTLLAFAIGFPTAYGISKLPQQWRMVALVLVVVPFWTNFLIRVYAWIVLLNSQGLVNDALVGMGLLDQRVGLLYTDAAVVVATDRHRYRRLVEHEIEGFAVAAARKLFTHSPPPVPTCGRRRDSPAAS